MGLREVVVVESLVRFSVYLVYVLFDLSCGWGFWVGFVVRWGLVGFLYGVIG